MQRINGVRIHEGKVSAMRSTRLLVAIVFVTMGAFAQQPPPPAITPAGATAAVDPKLHGNVVKLVELMGTRQKIESNLDSMVQTGKGKMLEQFPNINPVFAEEWAKRMRSRLKADDFVDLTVKVYEKHFSNDEIEELIQIQRDMNESKTPTVSPHMKEKASAEMSSVMSEIMGSFTQFGAKLGSDVGQEIGTEHPKWLKDVKPAELPAAK